jgi:hypothetical protein
VSYAITVTFRQVIKETIMNESTKEEFESLGRHALHGAEDTVDVVGHGLAGTAKGVVDGVKSLPDRSEDPGKS